MPVKYHINKCTKQPLPDCVSALRLKALAIGRRSRTCTRECYLRAVHCLHAIDMNAGNMPQPNDGTSTPTDQPIPQEMPAAPQRGVNILEPLQPLTAVQIARMQALFQQAVERLAQIEAARQQED